MDPETAFAECRSEMERGARRIRVFVFVALIAAVILVVGLVQRHHWL